jgi:hypothetical protein
MGDGTRSLKKPEKKAKKKKSAKHNRKKKKYPLFTSSVTDIHQSLGDYHELPYLVIL